jgi:hypothetical protein
MSAMKTLDEELLTGLAPGTWAAISSDQDTIVATGQTVEEVVKAAHEHGEDQPFIVRVPTENSTLIL